MGIRSILLFLSLVLTISSEAKIFEKVELKDGSIYEGYIMEQLPGKTVTVHVEAATILQSANKVSIVRKEDFLFSQLPEEWKAWAQVNKGYLRSVNGEKHLTLWYLEQYAELAKDNTDINDNDSVASIIVDDFEDENNCIPEIPQQHLVFVLEKGNNIKYVDLTRENKIINYSDIKQITRNTRHDDELSGINDLIKTRSGEVVKGQIVSLEMGNGIKILTDEGFVQTVSYADIAEQLKEKVNEDQDLYEQSPFLDVVLTEGKKYTGIIVKQNYGTTTIPGYLIIQDKASTDVRIPVKDVVVLQKIVNESYSPLRDLHIEEGEFFFNRLKVSPVECVQNKKYKVFVIKDNVIDNHDILQIPDGRLVVETLDTPENKKCILLNVNKRQVGKNESYAFDYEDILSNAVPAESVRTIRRKFLRTDYIVSQGKNYFLYNPVSMNGYFLEIR